MGETCPKCRREIVPNHAMHESPLIAGEWCWGMGAYACDIAAAAYQRGRRDGIAWAKRTVNAIVARPIHGGWRIKFDWTETDRDERGTR